MKSKSVQQTSLGRAEPSSLEQLCGGDLDLYHAMQHFLLLDPESQIPRIGETNTFIARGNEAKARGERQFARPDYEIAARIEIARGNKENVRKCLSLAREVSEPSPEQERLDKMLQNVERVVDIAEKYYAPLRGKPNLQQEMEADAISPIASRQVLSN